MPINVLISCARKCQEKQLVKEWLKTEPIIGNVYDCNDTPTDYERDNPKQDDIDRHIRIATDWFIFLCPFEFVGEGTYHELEVAIEAGPDKTKLPFISIFYSKDPVKELQKCNELLDKDNKIVPHPEDKFRADIDELLGKGHYFPDKYEEGQLINDLKKELENLLDNQLMMRKYEIDSKDISAVDIFFDPKRTETENGFNDYYLERLHDEKMLRSQRNHILLRGAPASGKTRAVYEYIKNHSEGDSRVISVRGVKNLTKTAAGHRLVSLSALVEDLKKYDEYLEREELCVHVKNDYSRFIVIDQIDSMLADDLLLKELFQRSSSKRRPCYQIIMTSTDSGYQAFQSLFDKLAEIETKECDNYIIHSLNIITIDKISTTDAQKVWNKLGKHDTALPKGNVIGDYIDKLTSYNDRIIQEVRKFKSVWQDSSVVNKGEMTLEGHIYNSIAAFFRAVQLVKRMRRNANLPLCLIAMVTREELWQGYGKGHYQHNRTEFNNLFAIDFCNIVSKLKDCNIIDIADSKVTENDDFFSEILGTIPSVDDFNLSPDKISFTNREIYDGEEMVTLMSPSIILTVINDKLWDEINEKTKYQYEFSVNHENRSRKKPASYSRDEAKRAMDVWFEAFKEFAPWITLRRILTRSPMIKLDKLQKTEFGDNKDNNFWLVYEKMKQLDRNIDKDENFHDYFTLFIARMGDVNRIKNALEKHPEYNTIDMVCELYGQALSHYKSLAKTERESIYDDEFRLLADEVFLTLDFPHNCPIDKQIYYHQRQIQMCQSYEEIKLYIDNNEIMDLLDNAQANQQQSCSPASLLFFNIRQLFDFMAGFIVDDENLKDWIERLKRNHLSMTQANIMAILDQSSQTDNEHSQKQHILIRSLVKLMDDTLRSLSDKENDEFNQSLCLLLKNKAAVLVAEIIKRLPTLTAAQEILQTADKWIEKELINFDEDTQTIWMSLAISRTQNYEFNFLLKEITDANTHLIKKNWLENTILREKLFLCCPGVDDTWEMFESLYCNSEEAKKRPLSPFLVSNIFKKSRKKYISLEKAAVNRSYEFFMMMLKNERMGEFISGIIKRKEHMVHHFLLDIYDCVVTDKQEEHFISFLGKDNWKDFCDLDETAALRIKKKRIYSADKVLKIMQEAVRSQMNRGGIIDESLFNTCVDRLRVSEEDIKTRQESEKLRDYLIDLVETDSDYIRMLSKSKYFEKSVDYLRGEKDNLKDEKPAKHEPQSLYWLDESTNDIKFSQQISGKLNNLVKKPNLCEKEKADFFEILEKLEQHPKVMPNVKNLTFFIKNSHNNEEENKKRFSRLIPSEIIKVVKRVYCKRNLPITLSIINEILEGIYNYFYVTESDKRTPKETKEDAKQQFYTFYKEYAFHVKLNALSYYHLLQTWPDLLREEDFCNELGSVCGNSERLLSRLSYMKEQMGYNINAQWLENRSSLLEIIGQDDSKNANES